MGSIIRQFRETDYRGNFIKKAPRKRGGTGSATVSAFDREEGYELTALGQQFVHYAMSEVTPKIGFQETEEGD